MKRSLAMAAARARCIVDAPVLTLNDGRAHPQLGYGTYKVGFVPASASGAGGVAMGQGGDAKEIVRAALELGYRFLDCAEFYGNEDAVGEAIGPGPPGTVKRPKAFSTLNRAHTSRMGGAQGA